MSRKSYPNVNAANQYARNVVRGKVPACQFVIQACQRHIDDMAQEKSRKFRYRFDKDMAEKAAKFIQLLPHTKGEWAFKRMPITLEPWQLFIVCCAFGWVQKGTKLRRFREVYTEIPRKNGKSATRHFFFTVFVVALNVAGAIIVELPVAAAGAWLHVTTSW